MDTPPNNQRLIIDFTSYIEKFFPQYRFDEDNRRLIRHLGMWANRDPKFNEIEEGWHLDRGILLVGVPGVGKDVIFRWLRKYLSYLGSNYGFECRIVWEYAEKFKELGYNCFNDVKGNGYYQELARTDENITIGKDNKSVLTLSRETVQSFGNKILIGNDLINVRNNLFVEFGYQSHFSTNHNEDQLESLYGKRCVDRLKEMCNYMVLKGISKRGKVPPQFQQNRNQYTPPAARETTIDEHKENKAQLEAEYQLYLQKDEVTEMVSLNYHLLRSYRCAVADDDEMRDLMDKVEGDYQEPPKNELKINREKHKQDFKWNQARMIAVIKFYQNLKKAGAKTIFGLVDVAVDGIVREIVSENKKTSGIV